MKELRELTWNGWHSCFELGEGVYLNHDDGDITIGFKDPALMRPFIEKHQLDVDYEEVLERVAALKKELTVLEPWVKAG